MTRTNRSRPVPPWVALSITLLLAGACSAGDPFGSMEPSSGGAGGSGAGAGAGGGAGSSASMGGRSSQAGHGLGGDGSEAGGGGDASLPGIGGSGSDACAPGTLDCNDDAADGCEASLDTAEHCGSCQQRCTGATAPFCAQNGAEYSCENPAQSLAGKRLDLPCLQAVVGSPQLCETVAERAKNCPPGGKLVTRTLTVTGRPGVIYDVTLSIRGVLEPKVYEGGHGGGDHFYVGGTPTVSNYNSYRLVVSEPAQTYYFNGAEGAGESYQVFALDHTKVVQVSGGATLTFEVTDPDCASVRNCKAFGAVACAPYVIAGVPPAPSAFDGQFLHLEVVQVSAVEAP